MAIISGFQSGGSGDIKLITPPTVVYDEVYYYDGQSHGPTITGFDSDTMVIIGTTSETEIGNYTTTISLKDPLKNAWNSNDTFSNKSLIYKWEISQMIYGVEWQNRTLGSVSPVCSRTDSASEFIDPNPYYSGMSGTPSSPFDNISPWKDIKIVEDEDLGTLVEIPKYYFKWTVDNQDVKLQISPRYFEGAIVSPAHADRGDGQGERDYAYVGRYFCTSNYKSLTKRTSGTSKTKSAWRTNIAVLKSGAYQYDFAMFWTIAMLYLVEFANWDSQATIGYGGWSSSILEYVTGYTDSMPYHTGTMGYNRMIYGSGTQYRYIEGLWDYYCWCDGIYFSGSENGYVYVIFNPNNFSDSSNYDFTCGQRSTTSIGAIYLWNFTTKGLLYPSGVSGTDYTQRIGDACVYNSSGTALIIGYHDSDSRGNGLFCMNGSKSASSKFRGRLQYLPPNS